MASKKILPLLLAASFMAGIAAGIAASPPRTTTVTITTTITATMTVEARPQHMLAAVAADAYTICLNVTGQCAKAILLTIRLASLGEKPVHVNPRDISLIAVGASPRPEIIASPETVKINPGEMDKAITLIYPVQNQTQLARYLEAEPLRALIPYYTAEGRFVQNILVRNIPIHQTEWKISEN